MDKGATGSQRVRHDLGTKQQTKHQDISRLPSRNLWCQGKPQRVHELPPGSEKQTLLLHFGECQRRIWSEGFQLYPGTPLSLQQCPWRQSICGGLSPLLTIMRTSSPEDNERNFSFYGNLKLTRQQPSILLPKGYQRKLAETEASNKFRLSQHNNTPIFQVSIKKRKKNCLPQQEPRSQTAKGQSIDANTEMIKMFRIIQLRI